MGNRVSNSLSVGSVRIILILLISCLCLLDTKKLVAQEIEYQHLDTTTEFTSLEEALKNPEIVYRLNLRKQKLTVLPSEIGKLVNLNVLDVSKNKLTDLPPEIGGLIHLQKFDASNNKLEFIPKEIGNLVNMKELRMGQNEIVFVPTEIGKLIELIYLDLWSNEISLIPEEIKYLRNLQRLDLRMIQLNAEQQRRIRALLPQTEIYFSASCNCK